MTPGLQAPAHWVVLVFVVEACAFALLLYPVGLWAMLVILAALALAYGDMWLRHREEFATGFLQPRPLDQTSTLHALVPFLLSMVLALGAQTFDLPFPSLGLIGLLWSLCAAIVLADLLFILPPAVAWSLAKYLEKSEHPGRGS